MVNLDPLLPDETKVWGDMPTLRGFFTGRENILRGLDEGFSEERHPSIGCKLVGLYGLGGTGKSTVALAYASRNRNRYSSIFWINASNRAEALSSYGDCAEIIKARGSRPVGCSPVALSGKCSTVCERVAHKAAKPVARDPRWPRRA
jgi:hypothetical protein